MDEIIDSNFWQRSTAYITEKMFAGEVEFSIQQIYDQLPDSIDQSGY